MSAPYSTIPKTARTQPSPYKVSIPEEKISELQQLLKLSKIAPETYENLHTEGEDGKFGISRKWLINAKKEWEGTWNWRSWESKLNSFPNYTLRVEDIDVHFLALFSEKPDAVPVVMLHGWPGSILEFIHILTLMKQQYTPTTLPYHLIVPSLPGYAFSSGPPLDRNFTKFDIARIMNTLMIELGFQKSGYVAQGGDVGSMVSRLLGANYEECKAVHLNLAAIQPPEGAKIEDLSPLEQAGLGRMKDFYERGTAYAREHGNRTSTIGLVLGSNPLALLAWIGEKFLEWSDTSPALDEILASVTLYWVTDTFPRCIYPYREMFDSQPSDKNLNLSPFIPKPLGYSYFPQEIAAMPVSWVATSGNLVWSKVHESGGHFAALEKPEELKEDLEDFIKKVWKGA